MAVCRSVWHYVAASRTSTQPTLWFCYETCGECKNLSHVEGQIKYIPQRNQPLSSHNIFYLLRIIWIGTFSTRHSTWSCSLRRHMNTPPPPPLDTSAALGIRWNSYTLLKRPPRIRPHTHTFILTLVSLVKQFYFSPCPMHGRSISVLGKQLLVTPDTLPTGPTGEQSNIQEQAYQPC